MMYIARNCALVRKDKSYAYLRDRSEKQLRQNYDGLLIKFLNVRMNFALFKSIFRTPIQAKEFSFKLATNVRSDKAFCSHQKYMVDEPQP